MIFFLNGIIKTKEIKRELIKTKKNKGKSKVKVKVRLGAFLTPWIKKIK